MAAQRSQKGLWKTTNSHGLWGMCPPHGSLNLPIHKIDYFWVTIMFTLTQKQVTANWCFHVIGFILWCTYILQVTHPPRVARNMLLADRTYEDLTELDVVERLTLPLVGKFLAQFKAFLPHLATDTGRSCCNDGKYFRKCTTCIPSPGSSILRTQSHNQHSTCIYNTQYYCNLLIEK